MKPICKMAVVGMVCFLAGPASAFEERNWLTAQLDSISIRQHLKAEARWVPFPDYTDRTAWNNLFQETPEVYIKRGEAALNYQWKVVNASYYLEYERSGSRKIMENPFSQNNMALADLLYAELAEGKGRFLPAIIDGVFHCCEMTSWVLSAHLKKQKTRRSLPDFREQVIDLGSVQVSEMLAWLYYFLHKEMDKTDPSISLRLKHEIQRRTLTPFLEQHYWWMALDSRPETLVNNWNPWCNTGVLQSFLLTETDSIRMAQAVERSMRSVDQFINHANGDGGCDEGPSYWGHAAGKLLDYLQLLDMATEGKIRIWQYPLIRSLGEYISRSYVGNGWTVNFADASAKTAADPYLVFRYGQQTGSENMMQLAKALYSGYPMRSTDVFRVLSSLKARQDMAHIEARTAHEPFTWYPETEVGYLRNEDMVLAVKGGYNAESHNHNDAGTFSLYCFGYPVFIDIGVGTYTRQTFGKERYSIWTMQSQYHNLPLINGQGQKDGRKFRASGTTCNASRRSFTTDIAGAYPAKTGIATWSRTCTLQKRTLILTDRFRMKTDCTAPHEEHFMLRKEPDLSHPGKVAIPTEGGVVTLHYDARIFTATAERIHLDDPALTRVWGSSVYRLVLKDRTTRTKGTYHLHITASPLPSPDPLHP